MPLIDLLEICSLSYLTRYMDELRNKILPTCSVHFKFLKICKHFGNNVTIKKITSPYTARFALFAISAVFFLF